jgi:hypothetical protein
MQTFGSFLHNALQQPALLTAARDVILRWVFPQIVSSGTMQEPNISSNTNQANGGNEGQHT